MDYDLKKDAWETPRLSKADADRLLKGIKERHLANKTRKRHRLIAAAILAPIAISGAVYFFSGPWGGNARMAALLKEEVKNCRDLGYDKGERKERSEKKYDFES